MVSMFVIWLCWCLSRNPLKVHSDIHKIKIPIHHFIYCFVVGIQAPRRWTTPMASLIVSPQHRPSWAACEPWTYWRTWGVFWSSWTLRRERACVVRSQTLPQTVWWSGCMVTWCVRHIPELWNSPCLLCEHELTYYVLPCCRGSTWLFILPLFIVVKKHVVYFQW